MTLGDSLRRQTMVPATPRAPSLARAALADAVLDPALIHRLDDARLVISEVVANAVKFGATERRDDLRLMIEADEGRVYVEVEQTLPALDVRPSGPLNVAAGGNGLRIVEALTDGWGVEPGPPGPRLVRVPALSMPPRTSLCRR